MKTTIIVVDGFKECSQCLCVSNLCELKGQTAPNPVSSYFLTCSRLQMTSVRVDMLLIISNLLLAKEAITVFQLQR